jgi:hypothetical protein
MLTPIFPVAPSNTFEPISAEFSTQSSISFSSVSCQLTELAFAIRPLVPLVSDIALPWALPTPAAMFKPMLPVA